MDRQRSLRPGFLELLHGHVGNYQPNEVDDDALAQAAVALVVAPDPFSILFIVSGVRIIGLKLIGESGDPKIVTELT